MATTPPTRNVCRIAHRSINVLKLSQVGRNKNGYIELASDVMHKKCNRISFKLWQWWIQITF